MENTENQHISNNKRDEIDLVEVIQKIWEGRKTIYKTIGILFAFGLIYVIGSPKEYTSEVILLVETGATSGGMSGFFQQFGALAGFNLGGVAGNEALTPKIYPDIIKSTPFLLEIMNQKVIESKHDSNITVYKYLAEQTRPSLGTTVRSYTLGLPVKIYGLFKGKEKDPLPADNVAEQKLNKFTPEEIGIASLLSQRIKLTQGNTLSIKVEMQDPAVAAQLCDSVVKSLTHYVTDYHTQKAINDLEFVKKRHSEAEKQFRNAQKALALFQDKNKNMVLASAQTAVQNLQSEYNLAFNIYNTLSQQLEQSKMKVQEQTPVFKVIDPAKVPFSKSKPRTRLVLIAMIFLGGFIGGGIEFGKYIYYFIKDKE